VARLLSDAKTFVGDAKSSLGDAISSLGDAKSSLGDAKSFVCDTTSWLDDAKSSLGDAGWLLTGEDCGVPQAAGGDGVHQERLRVEEGARAPGGRAGGACPGQDRPPGGVPGVHP
jgi:hypothetical protein